MKLANARTLASLLKRHGVRPIKRLGQNFLADEKILEAFIAACALSKRNSVVEIGPGVGTLTVELASRVRRVLTIEKDGRLLPILLENLRLLPNIFLRMGDARRIRPETLPFKRYQLVGSFPYHAAAYLLRRYLETRNPPRSITAILQREAAERICAAPPRANLLSLAVQYFGTPRFIMRVPRSAFYPQPHVDSAIVRISDIQNRMEEESQLTRSFFRLLRHAFSSPRKQLLPQLVRRIHAARKSLEHTLSAYGYSPSVRPQELALPAWISLAKKLRARLAE